MESRNIIVRRATIRDAGIIAQAVAIAIGDQKALKDYCGEDYMTTLTHIVRTRETQYSWQQALIAEVDGVTAGAVVGYDGAHLHALRERTFTVLRNIIGRTPSITDETEAGEYYLDSIAVLPQFRGQGVGSKLIETFCKMAFCDGHAHVGLIVDSINTKAERLYSSLGFKRVGTRQFFGHTMWHLQRTTDLDIRQRVESSTHITPFQRKVYMELLNTAEGETITYGELARRIGCRSAQAIGQALKRNPFAPDVPCHRVIASNGTIGGYNGKRDGEAIERKRTLLEAEKRIKKIDHTQR